MKLEILQQEVYSARRAFYETLGKVDDDVIAFAINPGFMGGPMWPGTRQAYFIVRRPNGNIGIGSDGLSDPFEEDYDENNPNDGFGLELYVETSDDIGNDFQSISKSWLFRLVCEMSHQAACQGNLADRMMNYPIMSMGLYDDGNFTAISEDGGYGVLFGLDTDVGQLKFTTPVGEIPVAPIKLLTQPQLKYVIERGQSARMALNKEFKAKGEFHVNMMSKY